MKIVPVYEQNIHLFRGFIPSHLIVGNMKFYGCVKDEQPIGVAVTESYQYRDHIVWIYIAPEYRGNGAGTLLIDSVVKQAKGKSLEFFYDNIGKSAEILTGMLMRRGFLVTVKKHCHCRAGLDIIKNSPVITHSSHTAQNAVFKPISDIPGFRFRELIANYEKSGAFHISRADYAGCDKDLSLVCIRDEKIAGMMLVKNRGEGVLELQFMYLSNEYRMGGLSMLRVQTEHILKNIPYLKEVRFTCMTETVEKIAEKMLPGTEKSWIEIYRAKRL